MNIELLLTGKTDLEYLKKGIFLYEKRLKHYCNFNRIEIPQLKRVSSLKENQIKIKEGELILKNISDQDVLILLDERGAKISSQDFAQRIENWAVRGIKKVIFTVGGAYGFSEEVYERANGMISLSNMTFSHQMVRLIFVEQLYRAFTIIKGEPYHHK
ncbi:MAG: 23S rRNA (pseudouridine(1915)-N(3))-methyltransferase RlmH [Bacteroidales bacterium]|nr:23S rRNA (pseudouridine(1915)-N(3))-methyltransferase RlmH [Bacteroidales bacterium]MDD4656928.1 23S rRNA (pseudouridine(1915)-N(3))-methyltransferase RlmH [Bacteroidales bacterium]